MLHRLEAPCETSSWRSQKFTTASRCCGCFFLPSPLTPRTPAEASLLNSSHFHTAPTPPHTAPGRAPASGSPSLLPPNLPPLAPVVPSLGVPPSHPGLGLPQETPGASRFQADLSSCLWEGGHLLFPAKMPSMHFFLPFSTTKRLFCARSPIPPLGPRDASRVFLVSFFFFWQPFQNKQKMSKQRWKGLLVHQVACL